MSIDDSEEKLRRNVVAVSTVILAAMFMGQKVKDNAELAGFIVATDFHQSSSGSLPL